MNNFLIIDDYVLLDIETTGLDTENDRIIEISAIKVSGKEIVEEFSTLVNPGIHIPFYASSVNGITDDMVKDSPSINEALKDFLKFAGNSILAGHNIRRFDLRFIQRESLNCFGKNITNKILDTLDVARRYLPELESCSLESLAYHYDISYDGAHRALADCHINKRVYDMLAKEAENPSEAAKQVKTCPRCGNLLKKRNGKFGEFLGCASYPDCRYTQDC